MERVTPSEQTFKMRRRVVVSSFVVLLALALGFLWIQFFTTLRTGNLFMDGLLPLGNLIVSALTVVAGVGMTRVLKGDHIKIDQSGLSYPLWMRRHISWGNVARLEFSYKHGLFGVRVIMIHGFPRWISTQNIADPQGFLHAMESWWSRSKTN